MKSDVTAFLSRAGAVGKEMQNYGADIRNHFETLFTHRRMTVYESLPESRSFVDVTVLEPTEEEPFYFLYTSGMSRMSSDLTVSCRVGRLSPYVRHVVFLRFLFTLGQRL